MSAQRKLVPAEFASAIKRPGVQVLDVRTQKEYASGHLDSVFLADWTNRTVFTDRVASLDKSKPVYAYCLSGGRSAQAAIWLDSAGFTVYNLDGGLNAWKQAGLPLLQTSRAAQMTEPAFNSLINSATVVLLDIGASWCPPCRKMNPILDSMVAKSMNRFTLIRVDGEAQEDLNKKLSVKAFPTFIIYKNGRETWRGEGIIDAALLAERLYQPIP